MTPNVTDAPDRVARAFYTMLQREGFEDEQIVALATQLVEMVTDDLRECPPQSLDSLAAK